MKAKIIGAVLSFAIVTPALLPDAAMAARHHHYRCKRSSGTTGLIAGGAGGALLGHAVVGGPVATVAGGVGGALLGKHLDKKHDAAQNRRNGC